MVTAVALMISIPVGIATAGFYMPFRLAEDYLLVPKITGRAVKVPAGVTVVAVLIGGTLLGIVGALIAIPAAAALHLLTQELPVPISTRRDQLAAVARRRVLFRSLRCIRMACTWWSCARCA